LNRAENGQPPVKIKTYDFGGQETYALGQSQYFDNGGMYILVVNADETNAQVFIAHLQRLQAMAPNAVVLVVLSKIDLLKTEKELQDKVEWIKNEIQNFNDHADAATLKEKHTSRRHIPTEIIPLTVQDEPAMAKKSIMNAIQKLLDTQSSMFPSVGMELPTSWLESMAFIESLSIHGPDDHSNLDKKIKELTRNRSNSHSSHAEASEANNREKEINGSVPKDNNGYTDTANGDLKGYDGAPYPYIRREKLEKAWIGYSERQDTQKGDDESMNLLNDVLDLMKAQGDIIIYGTLVFLDPTFSASVMKALTDYRMTIDMLKSPKVATELRRYLEKCKLNYGSFEESFKNFINHGKLNLEVLQYLFRYLPIHFDDYDRIIRMLVETFAIFLSRKEVDTTLDGPTKPVVLFHLPNEPDFEIIKKRWPSDYPKDKYHHYEVRFEFPLGCPASLAGHFAASFHALGTCLSAHINGALIRVKESKSFIYARLEKDNGKTGDYLTLAIRSRTKRLDNSDKRIVWSGVKFLEIEKKETYPGLIYGGKVLCPYCKETGEETTCHWKDESTCHWNHDDGNSSIFCESCYEDFDPKEIFGDQSSCMETQRGNTVNSTQKNTASQVVAHILKKPLVMMSARFNGDKYEDMARALASELRKKGVNVYIVEAGVGTTFGDKTIYGMYHMVAMICFCSPNYGQKTTAIYSSFGELKNAAGNGITLVPIKMGDVWPPVPPEDTDGGLLGPAQNKFVFSPDLVYNDWSQRDWDAVKCAEETKVALETMNKCPMIEQSSTVSPSIHNPQQSQIKKVPYLAGDVVPPGNCQVMISFNDGSTGEEAKALARFLTENGYPTFCTGIYCQANQGNRRGATELGVAKCQIYIPLVSKGWQMSNEIQYETRLIQQRLAKNEVTIIPVYCKDFDEAYDMENTSKGHNYKFKWNDLQSVYRKKGDKNIWKKTLSVFRKKRDKKKDKNIWMSTILNLLPKEENGPD